MTNPSEFDALNQVIAALTPLDNDARRRIWESAAVFLQIQLKPREAANLASTPSFTPSSTRPLFSDDLSMTPKEFLLEKQPRTDVERIACLAYYLTHYRGMPHFKTTDLSVLNTEAAQPRFANAANSANNAVKQGYLVASTKGQRQLSANGERFIRALPDRDAAKTALGSIRRKPRPKKNRSSPAIQES
jgi:hypothetical protein